LYYTHFYSTGTSGDALRNMGKLEESEVSQSGQHMQMIFVESAITNKGKTTLCK